MNAVSVPKPRQVHTITDRFSLSNTYLIDDGRLVVVDPGSERNVHLLHSYIHHFLRRTMQEVDLIVLTHLHPDHTAGIATLKRSCLAPTAASATVPQLLKHQNGAVLPKISHFAGHVLPSSIHHLDLFLPAYEQQARIVDLWLDDIGGLPNHPDWRVIASPGHTPESLCLYNSLTRELLCGDTVITIEGGAPLLRGSSNRHQLQETLRVLRSLPIHYLYPGHGRPILSHRPLQTLGVEW